MDVIIEVSGGVVQDVHCPDGVDYRIIVWDDIDDLDNFSATRDYQSPGEAVESLIGEHPALASYEGQEAWDAARQDIEHNFST